MDTNKNSEKEFCVDAVASAGGMLTTYSPAIFSISGRLGRLRFIGYQMLTAFLGLVGYILLVEVGNALIRPDAPESNVALLISLGIGLLAVLSGSYFIYAKRRLNDMNLVGWWALLSFVPVVNLVFHLYLMFAKGDSCVNDYGPTPKDNPRFMWIVGFLPVILVGFVFLGAIVTVLGMEKYSQELNTVMQLH